MVSAKKSSFKRVLITVISILLIFCLISAVSTKFIYDSIFSRSEDYSLNVPISLNKMVNERLGHKYLCGENELQGYLYNCKDNTAKDSLIILAPGFNAGADSYLWQINELTNMGYGVFAFDPTGSFASSGKSTVGFSQEFIDLDATIKYVENEERFGYNRLILLGHSRGGYAACCTLSLDYDISAVISISGVNSAMEAVMSSSVNHIGNIAYLNYGFLWLYQAMLFGGKTVNMSAEKAINESNVPVLIVHGMRDKEVPMNRYSIISHKDDITAKNVVFYVCSEDENSGHTDLLFDEDGTANDKLFAYIDSFLVSRVF